MPSEMFGSVARYFAFRSTARLMTLYVLNFMWAAIEATASSSCSAECSSAQNSSAAATRRSAAIFFHSLEGRNPLKS